jgi:uncharacterized glyoxalase superfamily protein PhnB
MSADSPTASTSARAQPESLRGRALSASLTVNDLQKSLTWYRDVVGFTVAQNYEREGRLRAVSLKAGVVQVLLTQDDGSKGSDRVKGAGFSLRITTAQNIDEIAARIKARGGVLESEPADAFGMRVFRVRDPDGFMLVISSERAE